MRITRKQAAREADTLTCKVEINQSDIVRVLIKYYEWYQKFVRPDFTCYVGKGELEQIFQKAFPDFARSIVQFPEWCVYLALKKGFIKDCKSDMPMSYEIKPTILTHKTGRTSRKVLQHIEDMSINDDEEYTDED